MGILQRISKVLEANLNALVERAEDPAKVLDQAIEDMKKGKREAQEAIVEGKTELRLAEKRRDQAIAEAADLERKALRALEMGDEALARKLVEAKVRADERVEIEARAREEHDKNLGALMAAEKEIDRRLKEMPTKRAALMSRKAAAEARGARVGAASKAKDTVGDALSAFERMEEKIIRAEVEAEVKGELNAPLIDTRLLDDYKTDDALAQLKAKMAAKQIPAKTGGQADAGAGATAPKDAVDDTLASLKAKLKKD